MDGNGDFQPFPIRTGLVHHPTDSQASGMKFMTCFTSKSATGYWEISFDLARFSDHFPVPFVELGGVYFQDAGKAVKEF